MVPPAAAGQPYATPLLAPPGLMPLPELPLAAPLPAPAAAAPITFQQQPGIADLLQALRDVAEGRKHLHDVQEERSRLRAPVPQPNLGKIVWEQSWGGEK